MQSESIPSVFFKHSDVIKPLVLPKKYIEFYESNLVKDLSSAHSMVGQHVKIAVISDGKITSMRKPVKGRNMMMYRLRVKASFGGLIYLTWFESPHDFTASISGREPFFIYGKLKEYSGSLQMTGAKFASHEFFQRPMPVYKISQDDLKKGIGHQHALKWFKMNVRYMVEQSSNYLSSHLDGVNIQGQKTLLEACGFNKGSFVDLFRDIHYPCTVEDGNKAQKTLLLLDALILVYGAKKALKRNKRQSLSASISIADSQVEAILERVKFDNGMSVTDEQKSVICKILNSLAAPETFKGLLSADVGYGKSIIICSIAASLAFAGRSTGILLPNEILVNQIIDEIVGFWPELKVQRVTSGDVSIDSSSSIFVGTDALNTRLAKHELNVDMLIVDEEQKFGVKQKSNLATDDTNVLYSTATCVPKTMTSVLMGGTQVFSLTKPFVEKQIETEITTKETAKKVFKEILEIIHSGGQVILVYPLAEKESKGSENNVLRAKEKWEGALGSSVAIAYGSMHRDKKEKVISDFRAGHYNVLIATSLVEVGVNTPNTRGIFIMEADRYGLSTLHQVRGRLARRGGWGKCFLHLDKAKNEVSETTMDRLNVLESTNNGFEIAERDLEIRGYGNIYEYGVDQSGFAENIVPGHKLTAKEFLSAIKVFEKVWGVKPNG
jgi:RecG-like helicase